MPVYPGAAYRPIPLKDSRGNWDNTNGPMRSYKGAVLHVNQSNGNLFNWVNGHHGMSCHFEVYKDGSVEQYVDTAYQSWCQTAGNYDWISIETEGFDTEPLTGQQVTAISGLYQWLHATHGIPLAVTDDPNGSGLIYHGAGGQAWGGHPDCPGDARKAQRQTILDLIAHPQGEADMFVMANPTLGAWLIADDFAYHVHQPATLASLTAAGTGIPQIAIADATDAQNIINAANQNTAALNGILEQLTARPAQPIALPTHFDASGAITLTPSASQAASPVAEADPLP